MILHHYDFSNYAEKARLALGYKALAWHSVTIPSVAPKPDLQALTGGKFAFGVLGVDAPLTAALHGGGAFLFELPNNVLHGVSP